MSYTLMQYHVSIELEPGSSDSLVFLPLHCNAFPSKPHRFHCSDWNILTRWKLIMEPLLKWVIQVKAKSNKIFPLLRIYKLEKPYIVTTTNLSNLDWIPYFFPILLNHMQDTSHKLLDLSLMYNLYA